MLSPSIVRAKGLSLTSSDHAPTYHWSRRNVPGAAVLIITASCPELARGRGAIAVEHGAYDRARLDEAAIRLDDGRGLYVGCRSTVTGARECVLLDGEDEAILVYDLIVLAIELANRCRVRFALLMQDVAELVCGRLALRCDPVKNLKAPMPGLPDRISLRDSGARRSVAVAHADIARGLRLGDLPDINPSAVPAGLRAWRGRLDVLRPALDLHRSAVPLGLHARVLSDRRVAGGGAVDVRQV